MDRGIFIDSSGASDSMHQLEVIGNNLANANTPGFRSDHVIVKHMPINDSDKQTRFYSTFFQIYSNFSTGPLTKTDRDLDISISGKGFLSVQGKEGEEAFTRVGSLQIKNGFLTLPSGEFVMGQAGVINIPDEAERITISQDGTIAIKIAGQANLVTLDRLKLVNMGSASMKKGADGMFHLSEGERALVDDNIKIQTGVLEGSNVNVVESLTDLIELSRGFEMHTSLMKDFKDNASKANQILSMPR
jgi:flagellar basal-body rod protein FlgF